MVSQGSTLVAKAIEIEETLRCSPFNQDPNDEEVRRLQYSLNRQEETGNLVNRVIRTHPCRGAGLARNGMTQQGGHLALNGLARACLVPGRQKIFECPKTIV
ncbi:unnamed protein product [Penicillium pancosmium]